VLTCCFKDVISGQVTVWSQQDEQLLTAMPFFFYSLNSNLPHCGMPEYITADYVSNINVTEYNSKEGAPRKVCFKEADGANDVGRLMCSVRYLVCPCAAASERFHGEVSFVHCNVAQSDGNLNSQCRYVIAETNGYSLN